MISFMIAFRVAFFISMLMMATIGSDAVKGKNLLGSHGFSDHRRLKKGKSQKSPKSPKSPKSNKGNEAVHVCLDKAEKQVFWGPTEEQYCDGSFPDPFKASYESRENGAVYVNHENAGGETSTSIEEMCRVPWKMEEIDGKGALCITNTCQNDENGCNAQKGAIEYWGQYEDPMSISKLESIEYSINVQDCGTKAGEDCLWSYIQLYTTVPNPVNSTCGFYSCRFLFSATPSTVVPPINSVDPVNEAGWVTYKVDLDTPASGFLAGGCGCPADIAGLPSKTLRNIHAKIAENKAANELLLGLKLSADISNIPKYYSFIINMGDTGSSGSDNGMKFCYEYFSFKLGGKKVVFDFEPKVV